MVGILAFITTVLIFNLFFHIIHWTLKLFGYSIWDVIAFPYRAFWWLVDIEKHTTRQK